MIVAAVVSLLALAAGLAGFQLEPDTALYARDGFHLWPAPLSNIGGMVAGRNGVVVVAALAAGACVLLVGRRRKLYALVCCYWFLFPGVDALGVLFVLLALREQRARVAWLAVAALVHPVAALTSWPLLRGRTPLTLAAVGALTVAAIVGVGLLDGFTTTDRYAAPLVAALLYGNRG